MLNFLMVSYAFLMFHSELPNYKRLAYTPRDAHFCTHGVPPSVTSKVHPDQEHACMTCM